MPPVIHEIIEIESRTPAKEIKRNRDAWSARNTFKGSIAVCYKEQGKIFE